MARISFGRFGNGAGAFVRKVNAVERVERQCDARWLQPRHEPLVRTHLGVGAGRFRPGQDTDFCAWPSPS